MLQFMGSQRVGHDGATELNKIIIGVTLTPLRKKDLSESIDEHMRVMPLFFFPVLFSLSLV